MFCPEDDCKRHFKPDQSPTLGTFFLVRHTADNKAIISTHPPFELEMTKSQTAATVLRTIADDKSLELFKTIAQGTIDSESLKSKTKLTRKQYYSRLSRMTKAGLVRKKGGKYLLTTFGKIVFETQLTVEIALGSYWKLRAIDSLEMSNELPKEEQQKLIDTLLDNQEIKGILIKGF
jgi:DNA-binding HxlR family transcriptional regulator